MVQIDGPRRKIYVKFFEEKTMYEVLRRTEGSREYKHESGEVSKVQIKLAGMGIRKVRIANLPLETPDEAIRTTMRQYGE
jgi:hypothetical protein